jgi:hypothetical protein
MTANTFTLVVRETTRHNAVDADILDEDGFIETAKQLNYRDYGVTTDREDGRPERIEEQFTVDSGRIDIQLERKDRTFAFRAIVDDEEAARVEVSDTDWDLSD